MNEYKHRLLASYHWMRFFLQWLKYRRTMLFAAIRTMIWIRTFRRLSWSDVRVLLNWRGWNWYKKHVTYVLRRKDGLWMIEGDQINYFFKSKL